MSFLSQLCHCDVYFLSSLSFLTCLPFLCFASLHCLVFLTFPSFLCLPYWRSLSFTFFFLYLCRNIVIFFFLYLHTDISHPLLLLYLLIYRFYLYIDISHRLPLLMFFFFSMCTLGLSRSGTEIYHTSMHTSVATHRHTYFATSSLRARTIFCGARERLADEAALKWPRASRGAPSRTSGAPTST